MSGTLLQAIREAVADTVQPRTPSSIVLRLRIRAGQLDRSPIMRAGIAAADLFTRAEP